MSLKQTIQDDLKQSLKKGKAGQVSALRLLLDAIGKKEIEKRSQLKDAEEEKTEEQNQISNQEIEAILASSIKKNKEAIEQFKKGNRDDLVEKTEKEIKILQKYLPDQLSKEEIESLANKAIKETKAEGQKDIGKVMANIMPKVKGRADGSIVSKIIMEKLSQ